MPLKITELWAWVVTHDDGSEGVPAANLIPGHLVPLMGADEERMRSLEQTAREIATLKGMPLKLMRFTHAEEVETRH